MICPSGPTVWRENRDQFLQRLQAGGSPCRVNCRLRSASEEWVLGVLGLLFGQLRQENAPDADQLDACLTDMLRQVGRDDSACESALESLWAALLSVRDQLLKDAAATDAFDPASESVDEVILAYPGFYATAVYRIAHVLSGLGVPLLPRLLTEHAHRETGIDIHPGASIGCPFIIDHGTGVVIGQTAVIGDRVAIYQGVTLGALAVKKSHAKTKRHPTIGDDVIIYANATLLGGETVVGHGAIIGGGAWVNESVPPGTVWRQTKP